MRQFPIFIEDDGVKKESVECSFRLLLSADMNIAAGKCRNEADMDTLNEALGLKIPQHVAVILDGNGRWAKQRHMPRTYGHKVGSKVVEDMLTVVDDLGVKYFTVYAFSTENWKRSTEEVSTLMTILRTYLKDCVKNP